MNRHTGYFTILFFLFCIRSATAQDNLFTQSFAHPVDINPAFAGLIDGKYRVAVAYRDQWRSYLESPYTTMGVYGDIKIVLNDREDDFFGGGFSIVADRTAIFNVNQNLISLYGSYHKSLNKSRKQYLSGGLNMGIAQRNLNYEAIYFNDQFNGLDQYSLSTAEILPANNFAFFNLGVGVNYSTAWSKFAGMSFGASIDHLAKYSISFYARSIEETEDLPDAKIYRKMTAYVSMELASNTYFSFLPRILFQQEGPHMMIAGTGVCKFDITNYDNQAVHVGGGLRINQTANAGIKPSAAYVMAAYEVNGLLIGLSHDITLGQLGLQQPGQGAFELSISFTGFYENDESLCPTF